MRTGPTSKTLHRNRLICGAVSARYRRNIARCSFPGARCCAKSRCRGYRQAGDKHLVACEISFGLLKNPALRSGPQGRPLNGEADRSSTRAACGRRVRAIASRVTLNRPSCRRQRSVHCRARAVFRLNSCHRKYARILPLAGPESRKLAAPLILKNSATQPLLDRREN